MRSVVKWSFVLVVVAALGCGGQGYQNRKAPPGEAKADPAAVANDLGGPTGEAAKPATPAKP